jgi:activator of HSP90 ATPase
MSIEFEVSDVIPATPEEIYEAWLDSEEHSRMTGGQAKVSPNVGDTFEAWDGYIQGKNLELEYPRRILQEWRTTEFDETETDSRLEILFDSASVGARVTIRHSNLPENGMQYQQGWIDAYLHPMKAYFGDKMKTGNP